MRVHEYRDLTAQMFRVVDDWSACVDEIERKAWEVRASCVHVEFAAAVCSRATERDIEMHMLAEEKYNNLITSKAGTAVMAPSIVNAGSMSRAAKYNRSASRAVRLARAARSAMRRGYF